MAKKAKQPGAAPSQSLMASAAVAGWVQLFALVVGVIALVWSIYTYYVPAQAFAEGRGQIELALIEEDFRQIVNLHRAIDNVSAYEIGHINFIEGERMLASFRTTRVDVLMRHALTGPFKEFSANFDLFKKSPTPKNRAILLAAAKKFAPLLDAAKQRIAQKPKA